LTLFEHARDHIDLHRGLVGGGAVALGIIRQILSDVVRNELAATADKGSADAIPRELVVQYVVGAYMAVLTWWLDRDAKPRPSRLMRCSGASQRKGSWLAELETNAPILSLNARSCFEPGDWRVARSIGAVAIGMLP
jgi:hypothetical protein